MLDSLLSIDRVVLSLNAGDKARALRELAELLVRPDSELNPEAVCEVLTRRERLASTGIGSGVAVPHGRVDGLGSLRLALALHPTGVDFQAVDGRPVHILVGILGPADEPKKHLATLAHVSRALRNEQRRARLLAATTPAEACEILAEGSH